MVLAVGVALGAAVVLLVLALGSGDDSTSTASPAADGATMQDHEMGDALPGCDQAAMHSVMMMFNPTVADGLIDGTCPWPYDARIDLSGGAEDASLAAPFEPRRYQELFDLFTSMRYGVCNVSTLPDPIDNGFVFGFGVGLRPEGCGEGGATANVTIREYATRAWRDAASAADPAVSPMVLGRWAITVDGTDAAAVEALMLELTALGAS